MPENPFHVLVVDDQAHNVILAETLLKAQGYKVSQASDGPACLAAVESSPPDLILLDVMMPVMDGLQVCRHLKGHKEHHHIPIILLTALDASEDRIAGIEAGADDFVTKPFNRHELIARVKSLVRMKRLEDAERRHMRQTLERYVEPAVAEQVLANPELAVVASRRQEATVLFVDVRGFTVWSERVSAEVVVDVMNRFLARAVDLVFEHGGMVDKYTGDGLMALFGAPLPVPEHARGAVACGLAIAAMAPSITHPDLGEALAVGVGINSDEMVVGNIGSERRLDYTAMGDAVNVAKRLCDDAPGGQVWVSAGTYAALGGAQVVDLGHKQLKHRIEPVHTYQVLSL